MYKNITLTLFFFLAVQISFAQLSFEHISVKDGLSQSTVLSIYKDSRGFLWIGTRDCLNRYDGKSIKIFKNDPQNKKTIISEDYIYAIAEDHDKQLWIGTQKGLSYYSPEKDAFEQITYNQADKKDASSFAVLAINVAKDGKIWFATNDGLSMIENAKSRKFFNFKKQDGLADNELFTVFEDSKGHIWLGTANGLSKLTYQKNSKKYVIKNYRNEVNNLNSLSKNFVRTITEDKNGIIWIGTENGGINLYNPKTNSFKKYTTENSGLSNNIIRKIIASKDGRLWIGTMKGLNVFDPKTELFQVFEHDFENDKSINDNSIKEIYEDDLGSVWIGTNFGGVNVVHKNSLSFNVYKNNKFKNSISGNLISAILKDNDNLWIGTEGNGLSFFNRRNQTFKNFTQQSSNISSNTVKSLYKDKNGSIWIGLFEGGLEKYDPNTQSFIHYKPNENNPDALNYGYVSSIAEDSEGNLWVGTSVKGLNVLNKNTQKFSHITDKTTGKRISSNYIRTLLIDKKDNIWVGTVSGLNLLRKGASDFELFLKGDNSINASYINCIKEDALGNIWIGTYKGGLSLYLAKENRFKNYSSTDGLISENVVGIDFDNDHNVWISTDKGLSKLNIRTQKFKNFDANDGLPTIEFSHNSSVKDDQGNLFFGTYNGLVSFKPTNIAYNSNAPKVVFTSLKLFNQPVEVNGNDGILDQDISYKDKITFKANQNIFSIDFVAINYINPDRNKYAYKLEGFEKEWNYVSIPTATYTNLPSGNYNLLVKAANNDGVWTINPMKIGIKVLPPLWRTWWAYLIYAALFFLIWYLINEVLRKQQKLQSDLYYEQINHEKQQDIYTQRLEFYTRISHEIRTPLTLIYAPLEKLIGLSRSDNYINQQLNNIKSNTDRLMRLINELLDFRKVESGKLNLQFSELEIVGFCENIFNAYKNQAEIRNINYQFVFDEKHTIYVDANQMEKVIFNLLANAFKYTANDGEIKFKVSTVGPKIEIVIQDNGIGIGIEEQKHIFDNFYQSKSSKLQPKGWGIGLALAKNIVELHQGEIFVESLLSSENSDGNTSFKVLLPKGKDHFNDKDLISYENVTVYTEVVTKNEEVFSVEEDAVSIQKNTLLIVEDNDELRTFLVKSLSTTYHILEANNGVSGLKEALENVPDLIISDVTMPEMDGNELCHHLKTNEITNHIPVIMLTAMASHVHQKEGLEAGANIYITKPFSLQLLELHIVNLLNSANALKQKFSRQIMLMPKNVEIEQPEEKFLNKLIQIVEDNMEDSDFNVSILVSEIGMSQTVLYKKVKALTGMTITDFLKSIRLKRAAQLLKSNKLNISEVAYSVGFNDRKYFSKEFKKQFGKSPTEFIEEQDQ